ncbi:hypothetical protein [Arthrobacter sp. H14]|uniref:hypothetical protein n=1 Tax=Arthrobacter sp. H14 TaxID=1312959 RepID=UPI00047C0B1D|nr:hypothetical protein [Arthrobacter sp. H14]
MKMLKKTMLLAPAVALGLTAMAGAPAMADQADGSYSTTFQDINNTGASGGAWIDVTGSEAHVTVEAAGLAETFNDAPFPHVQHIHSAADAAGECPTLPTNDDNGDGIIDTVEGLPSYGEIVTTFSTSGDTSPAAATDITVAPSGSSFTYERSIELSAAAQDGLATGQAVVVVHGIDPAGLSEEAASAKSNLVPELPLAATAPALCGALEMQPAGGADTGVTAAAATNGGNGGSEVGMIALGGGLLAAAGGAYALRRRMNANS